MHQNNFLMRLYFFLMSVLLFLFYNYLQPPLIFIVPIFGEFMFGCFWKKVLVHVLIKCYTDNKVQNVIKLYL